MGVRSVVGMPGTDEDRKTALAEESLPRRGETTLQLKLLARLGGDVTKRQLGFAIPAALSSQVVLTIAQPEADVEFPSAISFKRCAHHVDTRPQALDVRIPPRRFWWSPGSGRGLRLRNDDERRQCHRDGSYENDKAEKLNHAGALQLVIGRFKRVVESAKHVRNHRDTKKDGQIFAPLCLCGYREMFRRCTLFSGAQRFISS